MIFQGHEIKHPEAEILEARAYAVYPGDTHLLYVLAKKSNGEYVTWMYNKTDKGFYFGRYFSADQFTRAYNDFHERS